jgi:hypothetical protein
MHSFTTLPGRVGTPKIQDLVRPSAGCFFYLEYTEKKYAVQQKTGRRRMGAARGSGMGVNSTISVLFFGPQKAELDMV